MTKEELEQEEQLVAREFNSLLYDYSQTAHRQKVEIIKQAFEFAKSAHAGVRRRSGEPYILHPIAVARIVCKEMGLGSTSICSALLHDVVEDTDYTVEDIEARFGHKIATIVDGLTKISGGVFGAQASAQAENFRKLLLTMSEDIRVILIKIADRLHNMRTLEYQPPQKQYKIAGETQYIYAPLAHRLGLFPIKTELEDLSFKYEHPDIYKELSEKIQSVKDKQLAFFEEFSAPIRVKMEGLSYNYTIQHRLKTPYSIWKKMQQRQIPFEDVFDLLAVRIIFTPDTTTSEKTQCWQVYSAITEYYRPHPERIRDWISTPKANGYEALHVTVMGSNGQWVEVQIRTDRMNELAEKGLAAHWKYKGGYQNESELDKWLRTIKEILAHPEPNAMDFLDTFKLNLFASEIFVFTPQGEIKTIAQGATVLDFAYSLHSELGEHCVGAKVNHKLEPLSYVLQSGDQIEILTTPTQQPQDDWVSYVTTAKGKQRLQQYFRRQQHKRELQGEEEFRNWLIEWHLTEAYDQSLARAMNFLHLHQPHELYLQIGLGIVLQDELAQILKPKSKSIWQRFNPFSSSATDQEKDTPTIIGENAQSIIDPSKKKNIILNENGLNKAYCFASCCHPIPGDEVLGFLNDEGLFEIHKRNCPEADKIKANFGNRIYTVDWRMQGWQKYIETIEIRGIDEVGIIVKILNIVSQEYNINIHDIHLTAQNGIFNGTLQIYVSDVEELTMICEAIRKIKEINKVMRKE